MKNIIRKISGAALAAAMSVLASCKDDLPYLSGNLVSLPDGVVRLYDYDNSLTAVDSTVSRGGRFTLRQPKALPDLAFVGFDEFPDMLIPVIFDGQNVYISGNLNYKDDITVSGTRANDELREYTASIRGTDIMARTIELELNATDPVADSTKYALMAAKRDSLRSSIAHSKSEFVRKNPSSLVSAMFLAMSLNDSMTYRQVDSLLARLDSTTVDNAFSRRMRARLEQSAN